MRDWHRVWNRIGLDWSRPGDYHGIAGYHSGSFNKIEMFGEKKEVKPPSRFYAPQ